jgi:hypothetical protein
LPNVFFKFASSLKTSRSSISQTFIDILASSFYNKYFNRDRGDKSGEKQYESNIGQTFQLGFSDGGNQRLRISSVGGKFERQIAKSITFALG